MRRHGRRVGARDGVSATMVLVLIAIGLVVGLLLILRIGDGGGSTAADDQEPTGLIPSVTECRAAGDTLWTEGTLRNASGIVVRNIEMRLVWTDPAGAEIAAEIIELVGAEGLMVDEATPFRGFTVVPGASNCEAEVFFFEPVT